MAVAGVVARTVRGRIEPRSVREHRNLEKLFRAAQEARNALIEDGRSARAWNLLQIRKHRRTDVAWEARPEDFFDWQGRTGPLEPGKLARFSSRVVRKRMVTRLRAAGKMLLASGFTVALARAEASRMAEGVARGGRKPLRYRGWRERRSVEWDKLPAMKWAEGSRVHGKLAGKDTGSLRFRLYGPLPEGAVIRSASIVRTVPGGRGVGPSVYELHLSVQELAVKQQKVELTCVVGVDAGGRATATDDCGATTLLGAVEDAAADKGLQREVSRRRKGSKGRRKAIARLGRSRSREKDRKRALCRKKASRMVRRDRCIVVEDLNHHAMRRKGKGRRKRGMNRSLKNGSPGMFRKAPHEIAGRRGDCVVVEVRAAHTSRQCVSCGSRETVLERTDVECGSCGAREDRDRAAAGNLVLVLLAGLCSAGALAKNGGVLSPGRVDRVVVREESILLGGLRERPESLGQALVAQALAKWGEHAPGVSVKRNRSLILWVNSVSLYG